MWIGSLFRSPSLSSHGCFIYFIFLLSMRMDFSSSYSSFSSQWQGKMVFTDQQKKLNGNNKQQSNEVSGKVKQINCICFNEQHFCCWKRKRRRKSDSSCLLWRLKSLYFRLAKRLCRINLSLMEDEEVENDENLFISHIICLLNLFARIFAYEMLNRNIAGILIKINLCAFFSLSCFKLWTSFWFCWHKCSTFEIGVMKRMRDDKLSKNGSHKTQDRDNINNIKLENS